MGGYGCYRRFPFSRVISRLKSTIYVKIGTKIDLRDRMGAGLKFRLLIYHNLQNLHHFRRMARVQ
jgi:hypothetical protein